LRRNAVEVRRNSGRLWGGATEQVFDEHVKMGKRLEGFS
jgi:hypothetical protein